MAQDTVPNDADRRMMEDAKLGAKSKREAAEAQREKAQQAQRQAQDACVEKLKPYAAWLTDEVESAGEDGVNVIDKFTAAKRA